VSAKKKSAPKELPAKKRRKRQGQTRAKAPARKVASATRTLTATGNEARLTTNFRTTNDMRSLLRLSDDSVQTFPGTIRISGNESELNGTLLIRAGVSNFASAVVAATQFLFNENIQDGDQISVVGESTTVTNDEGGSVSVIVMISATEN